MVFFLAYENSELGWGMLITNKTEAEFILIMCLYKSKSILTLIRLGCFMVVFSGGFSLAYPTPPHPAPPLSFIFQEELISI